MSKLLILLLLAGFTLSQILPPSEQTVTSAEEPLEDEETPAQVDGPGVVLD